MCKIARKSEDQATAYKFDLTVIIAEVIIKFNTKFIGICNLFACGCDHRV